MQEKTVHKASWIKDPLTATVICIKPLRDSKNKNINSHEDEFHKGKKNDNEDAI